MKLHVFILAIFISLFTSVVSQADSSYTLDSACRIIDQRFTSPPITMQLGTTYTYSAILSNNTVQGGEAVNCGVPSNATAIIASVVVVNPQGPGYLKAWPAGGIEPPKGTILNFFKQYDVAITNYPVAPGRLALIKLSGGQFNVEAYFFGGQLLVDVEGYMQ